MTDMPPPPPPPYGGQQYGPPPGWTPEPKKKRGGLATAALVLGIIGFILAVIPFANFVAYPLVILAVIFGLFAFRWGKAKAGFILGVLGLIATVLWTVGIAGAFKDATSKQHTVVYKITGSGKADISYSQFNSDGKSMSESADDQTVPWTKTFKIKGSFSAFSVSAVSTSSGKKVQLGCTVTVDGKTASSDSANSTVATVSCSGTGYDGN